MNTNGVAVVLIFMALWLLFLTVLVVDQEITQATKDEVTEVRHALCAVLDLEADYSVEDGELIAALDCPEE